MKSQTKALIDYLYTGECITRESAWSIFSIQNLTARLSELKTIGFSIIKTPFKVLNTKGRTVTIMAWKLLHCIHIGDTIQITRETNTLLSLKGRVALVKAIDLTTATAVVYFEKGIGFRQFKLNNIEPVPILAPGSKVTLCPLTAYVIGEYHPSVKSYTLLTSNPAHTIIASAALVSPKDKTHAPY